MKVTQEEIDDYLDEANCRLVNYYDRVIRTTSHGDHPLKTFNCESHNLSDWKNIIERVLRDIWLEWPDGGTLILRSPLAIDTYTTWRNGFIDNYTTDYTDEGIPEQCIRCITRVGVI